MYEVILTSVLKKYGIEYSHIFPYQKGYRNEIWPVKTKSGQLINVTFYKIEPGILNRIRRADAVSEYLSGCGLPTRKKFDKRIMRLDAKGKMICVGIYEYLPGDTIPWEAYTKEHIKILGHYMSDMHYYLENKTDIKLPSVYDEYGAIIVRMRAYFSRHEVSLAIAEKLGININLNVFDKYEKLMNKRKQLSGQQPLHMDFVRGNVLFDGKQLTGILDFEKTAQGHPIMDVARTLAFLLVDCKYKESNKVIKYFLYSGYAKRGKAKKTYDTKLLRLFTEMFLVYDLYKFLSHNPYGSLKLNEHYVRTRDILTSYGVVSYIAK